MPEDRVEPIEGHTAAELQDALHSTRDQLPGPAWALPGNGTAEMNSLCIGFPIDSRVVGSQRPYPAATMAAWSWSTVSFVAAPFPMTPS